MIRSLLDADLPPLPDPADLIPGPLCCLGVARPVRYWVIADHLLGRKAIELKTRLRPRIM